WARAASSCWSPDDRTRARHAAARTGLDPAPSSLEPPADDRRRRRARRRRRLRHPGGRQPEAVLLFVAGLVPVLPQPGAWRALLRADSVSGAGGVGGRGGAGGGGATLPQFPGGS